MKRVIPSLIIATALVASSGCSITKPSAESQFYLLQSPPLPNAEVNMNLPVVAIGPVSVSDYLKRNALVLKEGETQYRVAKLDLWGGSLEEELYLSLYKNCVALMPKANVQMATGPLSATAAYRLKTYVYRFDFSPAGEVRLEAEWGWFDRRGVRFASGRFNQRVPAQNSIPENVKAMSKLVKQLAQVAVSHLPYSE